MKLFDAQGTPLKEAVPKHLSASFARRAHYMAPVRLDTLDERGRPQTSKQLIRAQVPWLVTLLAYQSVFQLKPDKREYFVYAPMDMRSAVKLAFSLWRRWEKPNRHEKPEDLRLDFPKIDDATTAEPIDDSFFDQLWADARKRQHKAAGHPGDPFAFTCLDRDVMVYKTVDFQTGLDVRI